MPNLLNIFSKKKLKEKQPIKIIIDNREKNSLVPAELVSLGFQIQFEQLEIADYLVSQYSIERKTLSDFKSSIINKRIMKQLAELKKCNSPILILEGLENQELYSSGNNLHENAFRGFLLSVILQYKIPIIFTINEKDTAKYISVLAKKKPKKDSPIRASRTLMSNKEQMQFILEGFPSIGPITAKKLLSHFKTIKDLANASEEQLRTLIGKKAEKVYQLFNSTY